MSHKKRKGTQSREEKKFLGRRRAKEHMRCESGGKTARDGQTQGGVGEEGKGGVRSIETDYQ